MRIQLFIDVRDKAEEDQINKMIDETLNLLNKKYAEVNEKVEMMVAEKTGTENLKEFVKQSREKVMKRSIIKGIKQK